MKKKKKTKQTTHEQRKVDTAHQKKVFVKRVFKLFSTMGFEEIIPLVSKNELDTLYKTHPYLLTVDATQSPLIEKKEAAFFCQAIKVLAKDHMLTVPEKEGAKICLIDYFEIWLPLIVDWSSEIDENTSPEKKKIREILGSHADRKNERSLMCELGNDALSNLSFILDTFTMEMSSPVTRYFWFEEQSIEIGKKNRIDRTVNLYAIKPPCIHIELDGIIRPALRIAKIGLGKKDEFIKMQLPADGSSSSQTTEEYDVYIQSHAWQRFEERIDGVTELARNAFFFFSLANNKLFRFNQTLLIPYIFDTLKLGYFTADFQDKKIILRTFLFITANGTPEGQRLNQYTGLKKLDKKYLVIDKLSAFMASDIRSNPQTAGIFIQSGCKDLLNMTTPMLLKKKDFELHSLDPKQFLHYLSIKEDIGTITSRCEEPPTQTGETSQPEK
ncbi:MAG TPA: hypothetical protein DDW85_14070 [Porphyromonadaceae bacterium]|nr:hypothetical protein [Porphyromonadaceae bacterium]